MNAIYNEIGKGYDTTRSADPQILNTLASLMTLREDGLYLDVGCGTGNYTQELSNICGEWSAFDQSALMIEIAKGKSSNVEWSVFDVIKTSYKSEFFDSIVCTLAIHHFQNLNAAFEEISRVLVTKGKFIIFTSTPDQMETYWLNHYFPVMLERSIKQMPSIGTIKTSLRSANLKIREIKSFSVTKDLKDLFLYSGKQRPEMYLSEAVRAGISSFRNFCPDEELECGLSLLTADIESGNIEAIIKNYEEGRGDYCFLVAEK
jgi:ubiquinone/menaquinone biosynthesis C-methylase UbiE